MKGNITRRGRESWRLKFDAGRDPDTGERIIKYLTIRGKRADAERELRKALDAVDEGRYCDAGKLTVGEFLDDWLEGRRHAISPRTAERYGELVRNHIKPAIGAVLLKQLTTARLNRFYGDKLRDGRLDGSGGLSPQSVKHLDRLLHKALRDAVRQRLIAINPANEVERPKVEKRPKPTLGADGLKTLLDAARGGPLHAPLFTILGTGLRRGEVLALAWRYVDLDAGTIQVVATVEETASGLRIKEPKSAAGRRRVDLPDSVVEVLRQHRHAQRQEHLQLGLGWSDDTLVFPSVTVGEDGTIRATARRPRNFTKSVTRLAASAGIKGFSPHVGRHDHFTRLLEAGVHPKVAQVRAGHSSISVTLDVYSHATDSIQREAVERIENILKTATTD